MKLQLLSDLHLETERFHPEPAPGAELLVLAGDIDTTWAAYARFAAWPVPVLVVPGNHEFDGRDIMAARSAFRAHCNGLGLLLLDQDSTLFRSPATGLAWRVLGTTRWCDFDLFGAAERPRCERAAAYFLRLMAARHQGRPLDAAAQRELGLADRAWLEAQLAQSAQGRWDRTLVVTHFAPSLKSADPRYGPTPGTASFCNADDDLLVRADAWLHGHLHCRHDYRVTRPGQRAMRVLSQARGLLRKGEPTGFDGSRVIELD